MKANFYVVAPVRLDRYFQAKKQIVLEVSKFCGLSAKFPLDEVGGHASEVHPAEIADRFRSARFVLVDLSHERPSCYYELGVAQAVGVPTYLIAATGTEIHQAWGRADVRFYENLEDYRRVVSEILRSCALEAKSS
ncbi:hypothetical protein ACWEGE_29275 [Amycolatopsis sp. NPDC004747]